MVAIAAMRLSGPNLVPLRYSRARAFASPRFYAADKAWLKRSDGTFYDLMTMGLRDKLQCGVDGTGAVAVESETSMRTTPSCLDVSRAG